MEKYINDIYRNLKLSKSRKDEIKRQLTSDISIALENGETIDEVIARMGSAELIADEFNKNMTIKEKSKLKLIKISKTIAIIAVLLGIFCAGIYYITPKQTPISKSAIYNEATITEQSKLIAKYVGEDDFDSIIAVSTPMLVTQLGSDVTKTFTDAKSNLGANWGNVESFGRFDMAEVNQSGESLAVTQFNVSYENVVATFTLTYDKDMKLCGIYFK